MWHVVLIAPFRQTVPMPRPALFSVTHRLPLAVAGGVTSALLVGARLAGAQTTSEPVPARTLRNDVLDVAMGLGAALGYALLGFVLLVIGFFVLDLLTPGKLGELVVKDRNRNAAIISAAGLLGLSFVVTAAVFQTHDNFVRGMVYTGLFGLVGVALQAVGFVIVDLLTPGKLGDIVVEDSTHPAVWLVAAAQLAVGLMVAAAIA